MHKIRDWLYVSGHAIASSEKAVQQLGIQAMLTLFEPVSFPEIDHLFVQAVDGYPFTPEMIASGVNFVKQEQAAGKRIMISCGSGISRSVSFALASLKEIEGLTLEQAYREVRKQHPDAMPDHIHWESLCEYYHEQADFWQIWESIVMEE